jgi:hypothetical protein
MTNSVLLFPSPFTIRTGDLAEALVKWRAKEKMPALKGTGAVATISGAKGQIRRIISERGWDPLPEMKRYGIVSPGGGGDDANDDGGDDNKGASSRTNEHTPRREGKRNSRPPNRFASRWG